VFLGLWHFGLDYWVMVIMAALVGFHLLIELILIIHANANVLCKCCSASKQYFDYKSSHCQLGIVAEEALDAV